MRTTARLLAASVLLPAALHVQAGDLLEAARRDAAQFARELPPEQQAGAATVLRSARQEQLDRAFEDAYAAAHRPLVESVTTLGNGSDIVTRIKTPFGPSLCTNWREKNRFVPTKGKTLFAGACNR